MKMNLWLYTYQNLTYQIIFSQYFDVKMNLFDDGIKLQPASKYYYGREKNVKEYKLYENIELYATNKNITAYKSFILVFYVDID